MGHPPADAIPWVLVWPFAFFALGVAFILAASAIEWLIEGGPSRNVRELRERWLPEP